MRVCHPITLKLFAFHCLLFAYPLLSFLWRRDYPLWSVETGLLLLLVILAAAVIAVVLTYVRPRLRNLFAALLIALVFTLQFDLKLEWLAPVLAGLLMAAWFLRSDFFRAAGPVLLVLVAGAWLDSRTGQVAGQDQFAVEENRELPPVLHIVLDAFVGLDGLPPYEASLVIQQDLAYFFRSFGFTVYPRAYSRFATTGDSLYAAFNFRHDGASEYLKEVSFRRGHAMQTNAYLDPLARSGYRFRMYQTDFLDFCATHPQATERCWNYSQPNVASIPKVPGAWQRTRMLAGVLLGQSGLLRHVMSRTGWLQGLNIAVHDPRVFDILAKEVLADPGGKLFFAHVLLPHGPFAFAPDCSISYAANPLVRTSGYKNEPPMPERVYEARNMLYFQQIQCALTSLESLFLGMRSAGVYDDFIIVLHGDHGSLIGQHPPNVLNRNRLTADDYRAHFSTLFAVRMPGGEFHVADDTLPLGTLLEALSRQLADQGVSPDVTLDEQVSRLQEKSAPYIYLSGSNPGLRVDIDIFEN